MAIHGWRAITVRRPGLPTRWRYPALMVIGLLALPLMLTLAASIGVMPVSWTNTGKAILNGQGLIAYELPQIKELLLDEPTNHLDIQ